MVRIVGMTPLTSAVLTAMSRLPACVGRPGLTKPKAGLSLSRYADVSETYPWPLPRRNPGRRTLAPRSGAWTRGSGAIDLSVLQPNRDPGAWALWTHHVQHASLLARAQGQSAPGPHWRVDDTPGGRRGKPTSESRSTRGGSTE